LIFKKLKFKTFIIFSISGDSEANLVIYTATNPRSKQTPEKSNLLNFGNTRVNSVLKLRKLIQTQFWYTCKWRY